MTSEYGAGPDNCWNLNVDGSSHEKGRGAGLVLVSPGGEEMTYALHFEFQVTNNEAEYEALLAGLRLAVEMKARVIRVASDSQLVTRQVKGEYEARGAWLKRYLQKVKECITWFQYFEINHVPRSQNARADALSKLASSDVAHLTRRILVEKLQHRSVEREEVVLRIEGEEDTWMTPMIKLLSEGVEPKDRDQARRLLAKAPGFVLESGVLYKKGYCQPLLRCVGPKEAEYLMKEMHLGACAAHAGPRSIVRKILQTGYYWPTISKDVAEFVAKCEQCQRHAVLRHIPQEEMKALSSPWPFYKWGIDLLGPFPEGAGRVKHVVVAVDYFTKWLEVKPLVRKTGADVVKFVWEQIVCRFGIPWVIVSDNGMQFADNPFKAWCAELQIEQRFSSVGHPQANGLRVS